MNYNNYRYRVMPVIESATTQNNNLKRTNNTKTNSTRSKTDLSFQDVLNKYIQK